MSARGEMKRSHVVCSQVCPLFFWYLSSMERELQTWAERQVFTRNYRKTVIPALRIHFKDKIGVRRIFLLLFRAPDVFHGFFLGHLERSWGIHRMWQSPQMLGGRRSVLVRHNKVQCTSVTDTAAPGGSLVYKPRVHWRTSDSVEDCMSDMGGCYWRARVLSPSHFSICTYNLVKTWKNCICQIYS